MKSFVIYKEGDIFSTELADECVESAKQFNINVEKFSGIYANTEQIIQAESLFLNPEALDRVTKKGVQGCFLSHYFLWKKCIKDNVPLLIFEYDALMINPLPENILNLFEDYLNLDFTRHTSLKKGMYESSLIRTNEIKILPFIETPGNEDNFKYLNRNHIKGAFSYIIKPYGAKKLVENILKEGILPADIALNLKYLKLNYTSPSVARLNPKMLKNLAGLSHTKNS
jgi:GR25 family glycosyltransferase involved in LPS biosynthesis